MPKVKYSPSKVKAKIKQWIDSNEGSYSVLSHKILEQDIENASRYSLQYGNRGDLVITAIGNDRGSISWEINLGSLISRI